MAKYAVLDLERLRNHLGMEVVSEYNTSWVKMNVSQQANHLYRQVFEALVHSAFTHPSLDAYIDMALEAEEKQFKEQAAASAPFRPGTVKITP